MQQPGFRFYSMVLILLILSVLLVVLLKTCHRKSRERQESTGMVSHPTAIPTTLELTPAPQSTAFPASTPTITSDPPPRTTPIPMFSSTPTSRSTPIIRTGLTTSPPLFPTPIPTSASRTAIYTCTVRKTCAEMSSCEEAYYHLNICGNKRLDRDNDGVPCENICPGG
ncbi:hypothetical protein U27_01332 [Candidatus Vecturithrix granuli]|uniref:Excalibur calcium-binding domain-containing protein n=1 Tax=Vecturithrix granuli TaxID=1499967 RepID=A0A081CA27_VECG1|nr:hypothetical protein U27_01332 [Candidatus Vecturithrix granuli]